MQKSSSATIVLVEGGEGRVILASSIRDLLMGHVPGCANTAGTSYHCGLIIPLYCRITALICCIYLNILVSYSVVAMKEQEEWP